MIKFDNDESIPLEDFFEAYYLCRKRKRRTVNAMEFELDYEHNLVQLWKDVNSGKYEIGRSICFIVTRPKPREIFAADFRDRIVHHVVMMRLEPLFENVFINDNYNCRKGKGTLYGVKRLQEQVKICSEGYTKNCYIGKFDMKSFFMSIHKPTLFKMLNVFINENYHGKDKRIILFLVKKIVLNCPHYNCFMKSPRSMWKMLDSGKSMFTCGDDFGLPIGNLTSQCFANFYLHEFDMIMVSKFGFYGRYVDDYYIIAKEKEEIKKHIQFMKEYLYDKLRVRLHPNKIYMQSYRKGVKFVGYVIKGNKTYTSNSTISNLYTKIHAYNGNVSVENTERFVQTLNSYLGFMRHSMSRRICNKVFLMINHNWFKYIAYIPPKNKFVMEEKYNQIIEAKRSAKYIKAFCERYYAF